MRLEQPITPCEMCGARAKYRFTNGKWAIILCEQCWQEMVALAKEVAE